MSNTPLLQRVPTAPSQNQVCPACGWTADRLRDTGRMGCATCYRTFASLVSQAATELHGVEPLPASPPEDLLSPWPTRRALKK